MTRAIVLIPARMAARRLPGKPLADIAGAPMIVHVWRRAVAAGIGPVAVATPDRAIAEAVTAAGGAVVMTGEEHPNGTSRIHAALVELGADAEVVVNLQGDLPTIAPETIRAVLAPLVEAAVDIATLAAAIGRDADRDDPNVVKVVGSRVFPTSASKSEHRQQPMFGTPAGDGVLRCLYFTRATAPWGDGPLWQHIGIYAFRRAALDRYVALAPSPLEVREKLEQLRALEAGMRIDAAIVETAPQAVDTPADLKRVRAAMEA